jgi:glycosyltransferase involved in cell wall biosynthesis
MKIMEIVPYIHSSGGVQSFVRDLSKSLSNKGHEVTIVSLFREVVPEDQNFPYKIHHLKLLKRNVIGASIGLWNLINTIKPDILHVHLRYSAISVLLIYPFLKIRGITIVETYHSYYKGYKPVTNFSRFCFDKFVGVSQDATEEMITSFQIPGNKCSTIRNGIDFSILKNFNSAKKLQNSNSTQLKCLACGRLTSQKGFSFLVDAIQEMPTQIKKSITLTLIGEGPLEPELFSKKNRCGFDFNISPFMTRDKLIPFIKSHDLVMMPSLYEGLSIFCLEVLALGMPTLVSDIKSYREIFDFPPLKSSDAFGINEAGLIVKPSSSQSIKDALTYAVENKHLLGNFSKNALEISNKYDIKKVCEQYENLFYEVSPTVHGAKVVI